MKLGISLSKKSLNKIIGYEVGSEKLYTKKYTNPVWPGGASGVTIGIGYDLGYATKEGVIKDWTGMVSNSDLILICSVVGLKGIAAKNVLSKVKSVTVSYHDAETVFLNEDVYKYSKIMLTSFPGVQNLLADCQGAILSLVFNRGGLVDNSDRRKEMKAIKSLILSKDYKAIAAQFRSMKRLWSEKTARGLIIRREDEAVLVETCVRVYLDSELISV